MRLGPGPGGRHGRGAGGFACRLGCFLAAAFLFFVSFLPGCSQKVTEARGCSTDPECGTGAFCREGSCASSEAPTARVTVPSGALLSHVRLPFDGSGSSDADPGDSVAAYAWSARAAGAPCEPVQAAGTEPAFALLVACGGTFELALEVTDTHGVKSEPARSTVEVAVNGSPPSVTLSGPPSLQHRCSGSPLRCTAVDADSTTFALAAVAASPAGEQFTWGWSARPPAALGAAPVVTFTPADGPNPIVSIETEGTPIAGAYTLVVEVADALGFVASAAVEVAVGNRPPETQAAGTALSLHHAYQAEPSLFLAQGAIAAFEVVDPDGDPVTTAYSTRETGVQLASMRIIPTGTAAVIDIAVPGTDPGSLIGPEVSRLVLFRAEDGNGGALELSWPVVVQNRAPRLAGTLAGSADHTFDAAVLRYRATVPLADYVDDDGDPLVSAVPTDDAVCDQVIFAGGQVQAACSVPYTGKPDAGAITGTRNVRFQVADPWSALDPASAAAVIRNRAPVLGYPTYPEPTCARTKDCCEYEQEVRACLAWTETCSASQSSTSTPASDPDGDPIAVTYRITSPYTVAPARELCSPTCGGVSIGLGRYSSCGGGLPRSTFSVTASDGVLTAAR